MKKPSELMGSSGEQNLISAFICKIRRGEIQRRLPREGSIDPEGRAQARQNRGGGAAQTGERGLKP